MDKLHVTFTQKDPKTEKLLQGWIRIIFKCVGDYCIEKEYEVWASDVFSPFNDLMDFLENIYNDKLPTEFSMDCEGFVITFVAKKSSINGAIEFKLCDDNYREDKGTYNKTYLGGIYNSNELLNEIIMKYRWFLDNDYDPKYWEEPISNFLTTKRLDKLEKKTSPT